MGTTTTNLNLFKPELTDPADITRLNPNWDKLDEEIQAIKDGNASVSKAKLDKLDAALTKLNNEGSDVRQVILEKYGFDVFNEDGTINVPKALQPYMGGKTIIEPVNK